MSWTTEPAFFSGNTQKGWFNNAYSDQVNSQTGWFAVLGQLDYALTVQYLTEAELEICRTLNLVRSITATRQAAFTAIYNMTLDMPISTTGALGFSSTYWLDNQLSVSFQRALVLTRIAAMSLPTSLTVTGSLDLARGQYLNMETIEQFTAATGLVRATLISANFSNVFGTNLALERYKGIYLSSSLAMNRTATLDFPPTGLPVETSYATAGNFSYTIPRNCNYIDAVAVGGGGGGQGGGALNSDGQGGDPGSWGYRTYQRGVDFGWDTVTLPLTVGVGGGKGFGPFKDVGTDGGASTVRSGQVNQISASGGKAGASGAAGGNPIGYGPGTIVFNGRSYVGGGDTPLKPPSDGKPPGGGGSGGQGGFSGGNAGGNGAVGKVWFYAYQ